MKVETEVFGVTFQNPILLAAGTCGFGLELDDVLDVDALGGFVTKSVTLEPRAGNPAPRVAEFEGGMINSVGLANPGLLGVLHDKLPWIARRIRRARVFVSVAGHTVEEFFRLVEGLDGADGFLGFELNLSCPNDRDRAGLPFALDPERVEEIVSGCRARTERPVLAKLAPNDVRLAHTVRAAEEAGADGLTLVNTMPGLLLHPENGAPELGAGPGGVSGPALRPTGIRAVREAALVTRLPLLGLGGVSTAEDAVQYARAGAWLVQVGTASFALPTAGLRIARDLVRLGRGMGVERWDELRPCGRSEG